MKRIIFLIVIILLFSCKKDKKIPTDTQTLCNTVYYSYIEPSTVDTTVTVQSNTNFNTDSLVAKFKITIIGQDYNCHVNLVNQTLGNFDSLRWNFNNDSSSTQNSLWLTLPRGNNKIKLTVKRQTFVDTVSYSFYFLFSPRIYFPNIFTPNNDGTNDVFMPCGINVGLWNDPSNYSLTVKDQNNNILFYTDTIYKGFSSAYINFNQYPDGTVFDAEFTFTTNTGHTISGCTPLLMKLTPFHCYGNSYWVFGDELDPVYGIRYSTNDGLCN